MWIVSSDWDWDWDCISKRFEAVNVGLYSSPINRRSQRKTAANYVFRSFPWSKNLKCILYIPDDIPLYLHVVKVLVRSGSAVEKSVIV